MFAHHIVMWARTGEIASREGGRVLGFSRRSGLTGRLVGTGGFPDPGQQGVEVVDFGPAGDDFFEDIDQPSVGFDAVEFAGLNERREERPVFGAGV